MNPQAQFEDARWRKLRDADAADEPLGDLDQKFLATYQPQGEAERAEQELMQALAGLAGREDDGDRQLLEGVLTNFAAEQGAPIVEAAPKTRPWLLPAVVVAAAALVAVSLSALVGRGETDSAVVAAADTTPADTAPAVDSTPVIIDDGGEAAKPSSTIQLTSGALQQDAVAVATPGQPLEAGTYTVAAKGACLGHGGATLCFDGSASVRVESGNTPVVELVDGAATVDVDAPLATALTVVVAGTRYEAQKPTVVRLSYARASDKHAVVVDEGVIVRIDDDRRTSLRASRASKPSVSVPDAKTLLTDARAKRASGDKAGATRAYALFLKHYPNAPAAAPSMVTLGELYLSQGRASKALKWFRRYIKKGGTLDEEARYGEIRALKKLGRSEAAQSASTVFLQRYPSSGYASKVK